MRTHVHGLIYILLRPNSNVLRTGLCLRSVEEHVEGGKLMNCILSSRTGAPTFTLAPQSMQLPCPSSKHALLPLLESEAYISKGALADLAQGGLQLDGPDWTHSQVRTTSKRVCTKIYRKSKNLQASFLNGLEHFHWKRDTSKLGLQP